MYRSLLALESLGLRIGRCDISCGEIRSSPGEEKQDAVSRGWETAPCLKSFAANASAQLAGARRRRGNPPAFAIWIPHVSCRSYIERRPRRIREHCRRGESSTGPELQTPGRKWRASRTASVLRPCRGLRPDCDAL